MLWFTRRDIWVVPGLYVLFGLLLFLLQDRLIYLPDTTPTTDCPTPGTVINTETGLRGYYLPTDQAEGIAIVYHGNAGRACHRHFYIDPVHQAGYSLLLVEYPGYGETGQHPTTGALLEHTYVVATYLDTLPYTTTALIGESIGSGFASYHATHQAIDQLILISPLDTLSRRAQRALPVYPARWLLRTDLLVSTWASTASHTTVVIAEDDSIIPPAHSHAVYETLPTNQRTLITIDEVGHNDIYRHQDFSSAITTALRNQ